MKHNTAPKIAVANALLVLLPLFAVQSFAQGQPANGASEQESDQIRASKLIGATAQTSQGEAIGQVEDLIINRQTGEIRLAIIGQSSLSELAGKMLPIPWQTINLRSESELVVNVERERLQSAPTVQQDRYDEIAGSDYVNQVYQFYNIEPTGPNATAQFESQPQAQQFPTQASFDAQTRTGTDPSELGVDRTGRDQAGTYSQDRYYQGQTDTRSRRQTTDQWDRDFDARDRYSQDQLGTWSQGQSGTGRWDREFDTQDRYHRGPTGVWGQDRSVPPEPPYYQGRTYAWGQRAATGQRNRDLDTQDRSYQDQTGAWGQSQTGTGRWDREFDTEDRYTQGRPAPRFERQRAENFHGTIREVDPRAGTIRVEGTDGRTVQFRLDDAAVLLVNGEAGADLRDFIEGQEVQVGYRRERNGEAVALSVAELPLRRSPQQR